LLPKAINYLRLLLAINIAKIYILFSRFFGLRGSTLPGLIALKIYPQLIPHFAAQIPHINVVTGTNGKTTTNNMIANILLTSNKRVTWNEEGANLATGVATCFIRASSITGNLNCECATLEIDEAAFPGLANQLRPKIVVITNFFRDQLDRYGEVDILTGIIRDSLRSLPRTTLILNADDPLVAQFKQTTGLSSVCFGLCRNNLSTVKNSRTREGRFCPFCGNALHYIYYHYGQLGAYSCEKCGFKRSTPEVEASNVLIKESETIFSIEYSDKNKKHVNLSLPTQGLYNIYNALAAFTTCRIMGVSVENIVHSLQKYSPVFGRMELFYYKDRPVFLTLVKNPTGFDEGLATMLSENLKKEKDLFMALNDNDADGRDISWIWDVDFEILKGRDEILRFICSGSRAEEMALRLKYAEIPVNKIEVENDLEKAVTTVLNGSGQTIHLFSTYTALWPVRKILLRYVELSRPSRVQSGE